MKSKALPLLAALLGPVILISTVRAIEPAKEDLTKVYEAGRAAFNKGDYVKAKAAFTKVLKAKPDFDLAIIYMAQIRTAEAKWEARPRARKISETAVIRKLEFSRIPLADALEVVRRELEKAGQGPTAGPVALLTDLPATVLEQPVSMAVSNVPMTSFMDAVGYAGNVGITWHEKGISVSGQAGVPLSPAPEVAVRRVQAEAAALIIPRLQVEDLSVGEALARLRQLTPPDKCPLMVLREPASAKSITLDLRNIPLSEALRSIAIVSGMEVAWQPWGVGLHMAGTEVAVRTPEDQPK
jgi:tetratricopeptide (TPR) repeat protein